MLFSLGLQVNQINVSVVVGLDNDDLHAAHDSGGWVGSVGGLRNQADLSVALSLGLEVGDDGGETSIFSLSTTVWLEGEFVELGDGSEHLLEDVKKVEVSLSLFLWSEWMKNRQFRDGDGSHFSGGVKLHGAGTKRDHGLGQGDILGDQEVEVSKHLVFRVNIVEDFLIHEVFVLSGDGVAEWLDGAFSVGEEFVSLDGLALV